MNKTDEKVSAKSYFFKYTVIPIIPLSVILYISLTQNIFQITQNDHFYLEIISVMISFIIATYAILRGYAFNDKFTLFLGLGFHVAGFIDILHAVISVIGLEQMVSSTDFMAQTWIVGRMVMGVIILIAIVKFGTHKIEEKESVITRRTTLFYVLGLTVFAIIVAMLSLSVSFPILNADLEPARPYELPAAVLFGVGLVYYYRKKLYFIDDNFYKGILIALIIDIFGNLILVFSFNDFDMPFAIAHMLKIISMLVIVLSLASSIIQHYKNKEELNTELKKIDREKDEFSIMITHELKTPLTPIKGWCFALAHPKMLGNLNDKQRKAVTGIDRNADRMNAIINNLLDVQKLELNEFKYNYTDTTSRAILNKISNNFEMAMREKNVDFVCTCDDIDMKTDETRIVQVLSNLIHNSLDFIPAKDGKIEVSIAASEDKSATFFVRDNGVGISEDDQKNLFKKFYQIDTSLTRKHGGTGIGLTICKGIVEGLKGAILVESEKNRGTTFYFTIPINSDEDTRN